MKTLMLLRHAKSSWDDPALPDFQRPLAKRGRDAARRIGRYMAKAELRPDAVLCSGARRAVETWELIAANFGTERVQVDDTLYMAAPDAILAWLRNLPDEINAVLLVGHNPGFEELARKLAGSGKKKALKRLREKVPTGSLAVLTFDRETWAGLDDGAGFLDQFVRPRDT